MIVITALGDMKELELRYYATEEFQSLRLCTDIAPFDIWSYCTDFNNKQGQKQIRVTETLLIDICLFTGSLDHFQKAS